MKQIGAGKDVFELLRQEPVFFQEEGQEEEKEVNTAMTDYFRHDSPVNDERFDGVDDFVSSSQSTTMIEFSDEERYHISPRRIMIVMQEKTLPSEVSSIMTIPSSPIRPSKSLNRNDHHQQSIEMESTVLRTSSIEDMSMDTVFNAARILVELSASPTFENKTENIQKC